MILSQLGSHLLFKVLCPSQNFNMRCRECRLFMVQNNEECKNALLFKIYLEIRSCLITLANEQMREPAEALSVL